MPLRHTSCRIRFTSLRSRTAESTGPRKLGDPQEGREGPSPGLSLCTWSQSEGRKGLSCSKVRLLPENCESIFFPSMLYQSGFSGEAESIGDADKETYFNELAHEAGVGGSVGIHSPQRGGQGRRAGQAGAELAALRPRCFFSRKRAFRASGLPRIG